MKLKVFHIRLSKDHLDHDQEIMNDFMNAVVVKKTNAELISGSPNFWTILVFYEEKNAKPKSVSDKFSIEHEDELNDTEIRIYETLKQWRFDKAMAVNMPPYIICNNAELMSIARVLPKNLDDFLHIKGFGPTKISKHGEEIIALLLTID